jgi:hypothetical protein
MNKEHVVSFEIAVELKNTDVPQISTFYWRKPTEKEYENKWMSVVKPPDFSTVTKGKSLKHYSAFLASELIEIIPSYLVLNKNTCRLTISKIIDTYDVRYCIISDYGIIVNDVDTTIIVKDENLCNALGKMLIFLNRNEGLYSNMEGTLNE